MTGQMLEVGREYVAIGPDPSKKPANASKSTSTGWWEPTRLTVKKLVEGGYETSKGFVAHGAEDFWIPVP